MPAASAAIGEAAAVKLSLWHGVTPALWRQGIGGRLLDALFQIGRDLGCEEAWLGTEPDNAEALALYRSRKGPERLATTVGFMLAATGIASTLSAIVVGRLADRYGRQTALLGCCVLTALLCPLHVLVGSVWQLIVLRTAVSPADLPQRTLVRLDKSQEFIMRTQLRIHGHRLAGHQLFCRGYHRPETRPRR